MARALIANTALPAASLCDFAGTTAPLGWLMCDGSAISRVTYATLFAAISTAYGVGDGSTTFNLPDFRGRFARYNDNMGTGAASRDTGRVHGTSQTQTTAKNGLALVDPGHSHSTGRTGINYASGPNTPPIESFLNTNNSTDSKTTGITISGDSETRPINLSCNKIIKI